MGPGDAAVALPVATDPALETCVTAQFPYTSAELIVSLPSVRGADPDVAVLVEVALGSRDELVGEVVVTPTQREDLLVRLVEPTTVFVTLSSYTGKSAVVELTLFVVTTRKRARPPPLLPLPLACRTPHSQLGGLHGPERLDTTQHPSSTPSTRPLGSPRQTTPCGWLAIALGWTRYAAPYRRLPVPTDDCAVVVQRRPPDPMGTQSLPLSTPHSPPPRTCATSTQTDLVDVNVAGVSCIDSVIWESRERLSCVLRPPFPGTAGLGDGSPVVGNVTIVTRSGGSSATRPTVTTYTVQPCTSRRRALEARRRPPRANATNGG